MTAEHIVVGLFFAGVSFILKMIFTRIDKNEMDLKTLSKDIDIKLDKNEDELRDFKKDLDSRLNLNYDTIRADYKALYMLMENNKKEIAELVTTASGRFVTQGHCSAKQDLWYERFNNILEQNKAEHTQIIATTTATATANTQQMNRALEELDAIKACLQKLQQKKEC